MNLRHSGEVNHVGVRIEADESNRPFSIDERSGDADRIAGPEERRERNDSVDGAAKRRASDDAAVWNRASDGSARDRSGSGEKNELTAGRQNISNRKACQIARAGTGFPEDVRKRNVLEASREIVVDK